MTRSKDDPDLPGDSRFVPASETQRVTLPDGRIAIASVIPLSIPEQQNILHNQLRYYELQKLRSGLPNRYMETRYRH